jgi:hypothetical protein
LSDNSLETGLAAVEKSLKQVLAQARVALVHDRVPLAVQQELGVEHARQWNHFPARTSARTPLQDSPGDTARDDVLGLKTLRLPEDLLPHLASVSRSGRRIKI